MSKQFPTYKIKNVFELIENSNKFNTDDFKLKILNKKQSNIMFFTKKDFKKYCEEYNVNIIGNIRKRQGRYKNYTDQKELRKKKIKKHIVGRAELQLPYKEELAEQIFSNEHDDSCKLYDIREANKTHTVGYAWVGNNNFLRVTAFNFLWLLILIVLVGILVFYLSSFAQESNKTLKIEDEEPITIQEPNADEYSNELWYFEPFDETVTLTSENKEIVLKNLGINVGKWLCSYEIIVDGNTIHTTDAILPSNEVKYDLWSQLDCGTYELNCRSTEYDFNTHEVKGGHYNIKTTLIIEK